MFQQITKVMLGVLLLGIFAACASSAGQEATTSKTEPMPLPAAHDGLTPPPVWLVVGDEEILATTLAYSNAFVSVEPIDLPSDLPLITLPAGSQARVLVGSGGIEEFQARAQPLTTSYDQVFNAPALSLARETQAEGNQTLFTLGPINDTGDMRLDVLITFTSDKEGSAHYAWPLHVTQSSTPTASLSTAPVVRPINIAQLPSIPRDLLFLEQEDLMRWNLTTGQWETDTGSLIRWNHTTGQLETLSDNVTCYWVSADRQKVVLETAKGGGMFEIAMLDIASGAITSLVETESRLMDLAISPDSQWVAYIQSEALPDEWYCRPDLINFEMDLFFYEESFSGTIFSLRVSASQANVSELPFEVAYCGRSRGLGFCDRVLWSPDSKSILWSDLEGVWSFELGASQARLIIPQTLNQPDFFDNRMYFPWRWSPSGRYILTTLFVYIGITQVVLDTQTGKVAEVPDSFTLDYPGPMPAWMADGRLLIIRPALPSDHPDYSPPAIEIWHVDPQQPDMLVLENSFLLDVVWEQVPTGDPMQLEDGRLAFAILSRESGDDPARGLYFADPASLSPRKVNGLPASLSEFFWSETGVVWSPDGRGAIFQNWGYYPELLYVPTDGSAVYDLSLVIQGCCFTWLR